VIKKGEMDDTRSTNQRTEKYVQNTAWKFSKRRDWSTGQNKHWRIITK